MSSFKWLAALLLIVINIGSLGAQRVFVYQTPFTNGIIEAVYQTDSTDYQLKVFVEEHGARLTADILGEYKGKEINKRLIYTGEFRFTFDHKNKLVTKIPQERDSALFAPEYYTQTGKDDILGYQCIVYKNEQQKLWFYEHLLMKLAVDGKVVYYVKFINENAALPSNIFKIPGDYELREINYNFGD